jgi:Zn finger protein HypA/HybF involved in hydrogenase expression
MPQLRCPGTDQRYWKPEDISEQHCPRCGAEVEIWKDEPMRLCPKCQKEIRNEKLDLSCAKWCAYAKECPGARAAAQGVGV